MFENNRSASLLAPVGIVWVISLLAGFPASTPRTTPPPVKPPAASAPADSGVASKSAFSRLWEDPLEATGALTYQPYKGTVDEAWKGEQVPPRGEPGLPEEEQKVVWEKLRQVLFVPVKGMRYADAAEWRRQMRYAVQAALWAKGYAPMQADKLAYRDVSFRTLFGEGAQTDKVKPGQDWYLRVPYEDYKENEREDARRLRVCYINLDLVGTKPLGAIWRIAGALGLTTLPLKVASPPSTDWLKAMLAEDAVGEKAAEFKKGMGAPPYELEIFNTLATGYVKELDSGEAKLAVEVEPGTFVGTKLHQLIESDGHTFGLIAEECDRRRVGVGDYDWLKGGPSTMAVLSEWETSFGRQFGKVTDEEKKRAGGSGIDEKRIAMAGGHVRHFYYLRGLNGASPDGRTPGPVQELLAPAQRAADARTPGEALSRTFEPPPLPSPHGPSQYDYLASLGESLKYRNREKKSMGEGEIRAIGLIGTDVDDKLALLKVLRPRFPDALFFTNGMNAEYLQPENNAYTRNLIVTTHYTIDDRAGDVLEKGNWAVPPIFRTSTQPAIAHSIWAALGEKPTERKGVSLYEVGLRRWHLLETGAAKAAPAEGAGKPKEEKKAWVWRLGSHSRAALLLCLAALGMAGLLWVRWVRNVKAKARLRKGGGAAGSLKLPDLDPAMEKLWKGCVRLLGEVRKDKEAALRWPLLQLLRGLNPGIEMTTVEKCRAGKIKRVADIPVRKRHRRAGFKWLFAGALALAGMAWGMMGPLYGSLALALCGALALAWMVVQPREDHQRQGWTLLWIVVGAWLLGWGIGQSRWEPVALADGVCLWPAVALRVLAAVLAVRFIRLGWEDLCRLREELTRRFFLEREAGVEGGIRHRAGFDPPPWKKGAFAGLVPREFPDHDHLDQGSHPAVGAPPDTKNEAREWKRYLNEADPRRPRPCTKWGRLTLAVLLASAAVMFVTGFPAASSRGGLAKAWDAASLLAALVSLSMLCVLVGGQLWECRKFVNRIWAHGTTGYGFETEEMILLVARLTGGVGNLLVYPFALCFILLCAHSSFFERWLGLPGLYAMLALALGSLVALAWQMQRTAHGVRSRTLAYLQLNLAEAIWMKRLVLQRLDFSASEAAEMEWWRYTVRRLRRHLTLPQDPRTLDAFDMPWVAAPGETADDKVKNARLADVSFHDARIKRIEQLTALVGSIKEGAFGGLQDNPIVRGFLIPSVGLGSLELIQRLFL